MNQPIATNRDTFKRACANSILKKFISRHSPPYSALSLKRKSVFYTSICGSLDLSEFSAILEQFLLSRSRFCRRNHFGGVPDSIPTKIS
jgi:hypothetical protein